MKLPGINYGTAIQTLGRESVQGPIGVAKAKASAVTAQVNSARQVAGDMIAIGNIHRGTAREISQAQSRSISRTQQFSSDLGRLAKQGSQLTVDLIKADVATDMAEFERKEREIRLGLSESDLSYQQPLDPSDKSKGFKNVSLAPELVPEYQKQMGSLMEDYEKNANWLGRGMMREQMEGISSEGEFQMRKFATGAAKDFAGGQWLELMDKAMLEQDYKLARQYHTESRGLFTGAKNAAIASGIDKAENVQIKDDQSYDAAHGIMAKTKSFGQAMGEAEKIKDKEVRQGAIAIIQRTENTRKYVETQSKAKRTENVQAHMVDQMLNKPPHEWTVHPDMTPEQIMGLKKKQQDAVTGYATKTVPSVYTRWSTLAVKEPERFKKMGGELLADVDKLSDSDYKKFSDMQTGFGNAKSDKEVASMKITDTQMNRELNVIAPDFKKENPEMYASMFELVQKEVSIYEESTGKKMTEVELSGVMNRVMGTFTNTKGWDTDYNIAEDIKPELVNPLADYLRGNEMTVTPENMVLAEEAYLEKRSVYEKRLDNMGITTYTEDDLVDMFEIDQGINTVLATKGLEQTSANSDRYYKLYVGDLQAIDAGLRSAGLPLTTKYRMKAFELGR